MAILHSECEKIIDDIRGKMVARGAKLNSLRSFYKTADIKSAAVEVKAKLGFEVYNPEDEYYIQAVRIVAGYNAWVLQVAGEDEANARAKVYADERVALRRAQNQIVADERAIRIAKADELVKEVYANRRSAGFLGVDASIVSFEARERKVNLVFYTSTSPVWRDESKTRFETKFSNFDLMPDGRVESATFSTEYSEVSEYDNLCQLVASWYL